MVLLPHLGPSITILILTLMPTFLDVVLRHVSLNFATHLGQSLSLVLIRRHPTREQGRKQISDVLRSWQLM